MDFSETSVRRLFLGSLAALVAVVGLHCGDAEAMMAGEIDYRISSSNPSGEITSVGGTAPIIGKDITVADVMGLGTYNHGGTRLSIGNGRLNFTSGSYLRTSGKKDLYGGSGTFSITGNFDINSDGMVENGVTLLKGSISSLTLDRSDSARYQIANATITVTDNALAAYFGFNPGTTRFAGLMNLGFNVLPSSFNGGDTTGNVTTSPVPLPASVFFMLPGVAALFGIRRKTTSAPAECV